MTSLLLGLALAGAPTYRFITPDHIITMDIQFEKPYSGQPLTFYRDGKRVCGTSRCIEKFHGAVAVVTFRIERAHRKAPAPKELREQVTITAQSPDMPPAPPFDLTLPVTGGIASDLQVMGYDEDEVPEPDRERMRRESVNRMWRTAHQALYLNGKPLAEIEWRHTMRGIELVDVRSAWLKSKRPPREERPMRSWEHERPSFSVP